MKKKEIEKFFLEYITNMIGLIKTKDCLELNYHSELKKPANSNWYDNSKTFYNIKIDFNILPNIMDGSESKILNIDYIKKDSTKYNYIWNSVFDNTPYKKILDSIPKENRIHSYGISFISDENIKVNVLVGNKDYSTTIKKSIILKAINLRIIELLRLKKSIDIKKITLTKSLKTFLNFNPFNNKIQCLNFNEKQIEIIKDINNVIKKFKKNSTHAFIDLIADYFKLNVIDSRNWTTDNGWGSYTNTYIRHVIDLKNLDDSQKDIINYLFCYMLNSGKINKVEFNRTLNINSNSIGMVQNGGYTHVS